MVSVLKYGDELGLRRPSWSPRQSTLPAITYIVDRDGHHGHHGNPLFHGDSSTSWTVAALEVITANSVISVPYNLDRDGHVGHRGKPVLGSQVHLGSRRPRWSPG